MADAMNQLSPTIFAIISIAISLFIFVGYIIASAFETYRIAETVNRKFTKANHNSVYYKFFIPIAIVTLFVLYFILDSLFLVNALKFIYYKLYMKDLHLHANTSNLAPPDRHFGLLYTILLTMVFTLLV